MTIKTLLIALGFVLALSFNAHAYVDPNTGGFFFTTVLPFVYAMLGAIVIFWKRIVNFIKGIFSGKKEEGKD
ncbi:MAG: hypothetical protein HY756_09185 [Nitrospirae bacterium]|nr:hypothetical protein [Nitrospirota bacterium]